MPTRRRRNVRHRRTTKCQYCDFKARGNTGLAAHTRAKHGLNLDGSQATGGIGRGGTTPPPTPAVAAVPQKKTSSPTKILPALQSMYDKLENAEAGIEMAQQAVHELREVFG